MNRCQHHGAKCIYDTFDPSIFMIPCKNRISNNQPCSAKCAYCKMNHKLYCYYLEGYRHMLKNKNKQLCMMEYFVRQMNYLKNAIQHQLEQCEKLQNCRHPCADSEIEFQCPPAPEYTCSTPPDADILYCRPPDTKTKVCYVNHKAKCPKYRCKPREMECDSCSTKSSAYAELLDRIDCITKKLTNIETKNSCPASQKKYCPRHRTDSEESYRCTIPTPQCKKYQFVQCEPPPCPRFKPPPCPRFEPPPCPRYEPPPMCYQPRCFRSPPTPRFLPTSYWKPERCYTTCYNAPPRQYYTPPCESTCFFPKKKSSLVFEISYETQHKKKQKKRASSSKSKERVNVEKAERDHEVIIVNDSDQDLPSIED